MKIDLHYYVELRADFPRPDFADDPVPGELAEILAAGFRQRGFEVVETTADGAADYIKCKSGMSSIELMVGAGFLDDAEDRWFVQPFKVLTKGAIFGRKRVAAEDCRQLLLAVNDVLHSCERISDVRWYPSVDDPEYLALMPKSDGPIPKPDYLDNLHPLIRFYWRLNQVNNILGSGPGVIGLFVLGCALTIAMPQFAALFFCALFCGFFTMIVIIPIVFSIIVSRAAKRLAMSNGSELEQAPEESNTL